MNGIGTLYLRSNYGEKKCPFIIFFIHYMLRS